MVAIVRLKSADDGLALPQAGVLKAGDYRLSRSAQALLAEAREDAAALRGSAEAELEAQRRRGYEEGTAQARTEAAALMLETVSRAVDALVDSEDRIIALVGDGVRQVLGELDDLELTRRLARRALAVVRTQKQARLRVSPDLETRVRERIAEITAGFPSVGFLEVVADPRLAAGGCVLETELGVVDAGVETQMAALEQALRRRFGSDTAASGGAG